VAWKPLAAIVAGLGALLLATAGRYGYHRDELYFLACGQHLAWGYPDQPPLTPLLARLSHALAPGSLTVFRLPALMAASVTTLTAGLLARELGGRAYAQGLAALATGAGTFGLLSGHLLLTSSIDLCVWVVLTWLVVRVLRTGDERLWLVAGVVAGVGLWNKQLPVFLALGLLVGVLAGAPTRHLVTSRWLWAGAAVAAAMWAPVLLWQARHGWPQLTLAGQIRAEYGAAGERIGFFALQLVLFSLGATYLWMTGLVQLFREPAWRGFRPLAWAWVLVLAVFILTAGQGYYPGGTYPALIAAGAVVVERRSRHRWYVVAAVATSSLLLLPASLPVLSPAALGNSPLAGPGQNQLETVGWPGLVDQVAAAYRSIPPAWRPAAAIFTSNYGEAGAVGLYGPARGLPPAWSGHNAYGLWGPPPENAGPVVVVWEDGSPDRRFTGCHLTAKVDTGVSNEETDRAAVYVCAGPVGGWRASWPRLTHLSA